MPDLSAATTPTRSPTAYASSKMDPITILTVVGKVTEPWARRHLLHHVSRAVPRRARLCHASSDDRRPSGAEHRYVDERPGTAQQGPSLSRPQRSAV
jgi:hypothetical protein